MITVTGTLTCSTPDEAAIVRTCLPEHIRLSRAEPGCQKFNVDPTDDPLVWRLDEVFADRKAFDAHQTRTRSSLWSQATADLKRDFRVEESPALPQTGKE
ncbi:putative quinol monooxygenase [Tabrizicola sp.]|uniref:putative quinol monooxygenase n=1 Tax=Tabrizicola sp. TaxID=2005166 RepID=UPI002732A9B6|nr:antibiotic biosynthesis monooxygenase [Tabrizicola sp.]MDP3196311.1 antibiotic biosynthesis monooxygenase [Tabrizicola sp.]